MTRDDIIRMAREAECEETWGADAFRFGEVELERFFKLAYDAGRKAALAEPEQDGCDHCNHPLYAAVKCKVCGRVTSEHLGSEQMAEPVHEPVANRAFLERILTAMEGVIDVADRKTDEFDALRSCVIDLTMMLHTAPPQRKPLSEQDIWDAVQHGVVGGIGLPSKAVAVARAIERAHGIGGRR